MRSHARKNILTLSRSLAVELLPLRIYGITEEGIWKECLVFISTTLSKYSSTGWSSKMLILVPFMPPARGVNVYGVSRAHQPLLFPLRHERTIRSPSIPIWARSLYLSWTVKCSTVPFMSYFLTELADNPSLQISFWISSLWWGIHLSSVMKLYNSGTALQLRDSYRILIRQWQNPS